MTLIDADVLIEQMDAEPEGGYYSPHDVISLLMAQPVVEERKTGTWTVGADMPPMKHRNGKPKKFWPSLRYCSLCGHEAYDDSDWGETLFDWCPYCGADMRGGT